MAEDLLFMTFYTEVTNAAPIILKVEISQLGEPFDYQRAAKNLYRYYMYQLKQ